MSSCTSVRRGLTAVLCCLPVLAFAACGSSNDPSGGTSSPGGSTGTTSAGSAQVSPDPAVQALLPPAIRAKGTIAMAINPAYPPMEFIDADGKTLRGVDIDLANALTGVMGLKGRLVSSSFDALIPGLAAGKYDVGISAFGDTKERERTVDFVTYLSSGSGFFTQAQNGTELQSLDDLCGHSVGVQAATIQLDDMNAQSARCKRAGKPGLDIKALPDQNAATLAISSSRAQVGVADALVAAYLVDQSNGALKRTGPEYGATPYGIAVPKGNGLAKPLQAALEALIADGTYRAILQRWHVSSAAIAHPKINGAIY